MANDRKNEDQEQITDDEFVGKATGEDQDFEDVDEFDDEDNLDEDVEIEER